MSRTTLVNLYAGPGTGKSTIAAKLFALLKEQGENAELVTEFVKALAWENRTPATLDQFWLFGEQTHREHTLVGKLDVIVTDAPSILTSYYTQVFGDPSMAAIFRSMAIEYRRQLAANGVRLVDVWLRRVKPYDGRGRFQNEAQAHEVDVQLREFLRSMKIDVVEVDGDPSAAETIRLLLKNLNATPSEIG